MGQNLTHGIYLPDEGERNCYNGLAGNWSILDGAVGTIAEHTAQIAGKAPVAHTHGKSDITDLFNSANVWAEGQTIYSYANIQSQVLERAVTPANTAHVSLNLRDKNNHDLGIFRSLTYSSSGNSIITVFGVTQIKDGQVDPTGTVDSYGFTETCKTDGTKYFTFDGYMGSNLVPLSVNQSIGSSSYQWNNLYAKNYYYNGTAWGLDQINVWTNRNILEAWGFTIRENTITDSTPPSTDVGRSLIEVWGNDSRYWGGFGYRWGANGVSELVISNSNWNGNTQGYWEYTIGVNKAFNSLYFKPPNGLADLGTSTNKWKTLNGINPGALSLPRGYTEEGADKDYINIASVIQTLDGTIYNYTMPDNGWICVRAEQAQQVHVTLSSWYFGQSVSHPTGSTLIVSVPFRKNDQISLKVKAVTLQYARFYPMQGNV